MKIEPAVQPEATPVPPTEPAAPPYAVAEARAIWARFRKRMGRAGTVFGGALAIATLATEPISWSLSALGLAGVALAYHFPLSRRVRRARALLRGWESAQLLQGVQPQAPAGPAGLDPRLAAADAVIARLVEHAGADRRIVAFAEEVRRQLARVLTDARAVEQLGDALSPAGAEARLGSLRAQVNERIDRLMGAVADVYQAVLARDDAMLSAVLGQGEDALRQLQAREEVERLLEG